jgi:hypothetical protein
MNACTARVMMKSAKLEWVLGNIKEVRTGVTSLMSTSSCLQYQKLGAQAGEELRKGELPPMIFQSL